MIATTTIYVLGGAAIGIVVGIIIGALLLFFFPPLVYVENWKAAVYFLAWIGFGIMWAFKS